MLFTGKEENTNQEGFNPIVMNDLPVVKASGGAKFGFWLLVILTLGLFYIIYRPTKFNSLNKMQVEINEYASGIEIQLEKRYDTLTKLVDSVKSQTKFNQEVYENISAFRSGINPYTSSNKSGIQLANDINAKQDLINRIYGGIAMQFEQYPTLGADASVSKLMNESIMIEKEIAAARRLYNAAVTNFNTSIYKFPACVLLNNKGYQGMPLFIASVQKKFDVNVSFFN
ncbi:MAG: LemA family protein [Ureaplasma sp.]|nr:LemA family protein [Ureaplasma sp.]